ncbi:MAG: hypothetical protein ACYCO9_01900 [Streptosporangiaceae bacterium]
MDNEQQMRLIDARLDELAGMPITDDQSARRALTHAMATVHGISRLPAMASPAPAPAATSLPAAAAPAAPAPAAAAPADPLLGRLRAWIDRLVDALTKIVEKMAGATSFSILVGTGLSVSVNFGPFHG